MALINDLHYDIAMAMFKSKMNQTDIGNAIGVTQAYVSKWSKRPSESYLDEKFVKIFDAMGYDIQIVYKKKENQEEMSHY